MNTEKLNYLDRIVIDNESHSKILKWYVDPKNDKVVSETIDIPFYEGIIILKHGGYTVNDIPNFEDELRNTLNNLEKPDNLIEFMNRKQIRMHFRIDENHQKITCYHYEFDLIDKKYELVMKYVLDEDFDKNNKLKVESYLGRYNPNDEQAQRYGIDSVHILFMVLKYISNYNEDLKITETHVTRKKKAKSKSGKPSSNKNRIVKIGVKTYSFYSDKELKEKREYNKQAESWRVRGHYRYYQKTGKTVWVKPYVKGEGKLETKEYHV